MGNQPLVGKPTLALCEDSQEASAILVVSVIIAQGTLVKIPLQVLLADLVVNPVDGPLDQREEALNRASHALHIAPIEDADDITEVSQTLTP